MDYRKTFAVEAGERPRLSKIDASYAGKHESHDKALPEIQSHVERMEKLQYLLYADSSKSLLVVLQALDAAGKDGVIRHLFSGMNPQGTSVFGFKQPSKYEAAHDFLWRAHLRTPGKGEVVVFNRSYYEDVLVVRVHKLVPQSVWSKRYDRIDDFESMLSQNGTTILKFYLHISPEEQLSRFKQRLDDPSRQWKISESDYTERDLWPQYVEAYEDAMAATSTKHAPWYVIPSNHKWFRNLAISRIISDTMDEMGLKVPPTHVDIADIRRKYQAAEAEKKPGGGHQANKTASGMSGFAVAARSAGRFSVAVGASARLSATRSLQAARGYCRWNNGRATRHTRGSGTCCDRPLAAAGYLCSLGARATPELVADSATAAILASMLVVVAALGTSEYIVLTSAVALHNLTLHGHGASHGIDGARELDQVASFPGEAPVRSSLWPEISTKRISAQAHPSSERSVPNRSVAYKRRCVWAARSLLAMFHH